MMNQLRTFKYCFLICIALCCITNAAFANTNEEICSDEEDVVFSLYCPPTAYVDCEDEIWDLSWLPNAYFHDYSGTRDAGQPTVTFHLNDCNIGYIKRSWAVADYNNVWHKCSQIIHVGGNYFDYTSIKWPGNVDLVGCNPGILPQDMPYGKQMPSWSTLGASCSKIGYNYHDNKYVYGPGCYEIIRTWSIVDCCNFNPYYNTGIWTYNQRISVTSTNDEPEVWVPYDTEAQTYNCEKVQVDIPALEVKDGCDEQYIITNNSPYASYGGADASGKYPVGVTKVRFMVKYNCWKTKFFYVNVTVTDNSTPVPYCFYGLAMPFMGVDTDGIDGVDDGMVELWASDLDAGSYHPCDSDAELRFSFSSDPDDNVRFFSCEDVGEKELEIWVTDKYGKQDYCGTYVDLQNNGADIPNCDPITEAFITGKISSIYNNTESLILDVESTYEGMEFDTSYTISEMVTVVDSSVSNNGQITYEYSIEEVSTPDIDTAYINKDFQVELTEGVYMLDSLDLNEDYKLTLINNEINSTYIDTLDVIALESYLNGSIDFHMYQKMAADLNGDKMVDHQDLSILKSFVNDSISENEIDLSWVTYDPYYDMILENNMDVGEYPGSKTVEINNRNAIDADIVIFQMGDLTDGTEIEGLADSKNVSERNLSNLSLESISPNPFSRNTIFNVFIQEDQKVVLEIFDINGRKVTSKSNFFKKGNHNLSIEENDLGNSGIYFYILKAGSSTIQGKLILIN